MNRHERRLAKTRSGSQRPPADIQAVFADALHLHRAGHLAQAERLYRQVLSLDAGHSDSLNFLGIMAFQGGRYASAVELIGQAIAQRADVAAYHNNIGNVLRAQGKLADAVTHFERALALNPGHAVAHSNLLLSMIYDPRVAPERIDAEARRWNERHALAFQPASPRYTNERDPDRRLRIGYVSPDFRHHSVNRFFEPLLGAHDPGAVEVYCYAEVRVPDAVTERLKQRADQWRDTVPMNDDQMAERIRADGIDILVDLAGHTADNRLPVFARKPAPVQVAWLGYPAITGLATIDYRVVDAVTDPPDESVPGAPEARVRLEHGFLCYGPPPDAPDPAPPPSVASGIVTFGSFNNLAKLSPETLDVWGALLRKIPTARLVLKGRAFADASLCDDYRARFAQRGVAAERITLLGHVVKPADHLAVYRQLDVALDPFPYNGVTTTCEALWMSVPVVTLGTSDRHAGRVGSSLLGGLGLDALIARDGAEYVEIAAALAGDRDRLARMRQDLRPTLAASTLCDAPAFARRFEAALRAMWRRWCG